MTTRNLKKLLRTVQTCFPALLETKFRVMRFYRNLFGVPFENDFNALALFPAQPGALYLDVGANRGQSTDAILMKRAGVKIQLFEPNHELCDGLVKMFGEVPNVVINNFGLGDESAEDILVVPSYKKWLFDGLGSFREAEARDWLRGRMYFFKEKHLRLHRSPSRVERLDDLNLAPFFIKLDIQGYELRALKGGEKTLVTHEPVLLIESPGDELVAYLGDLGFHMYAFRKGRFVPGERGAPNTFFMTSSRAALVRSYIRNARADYPVAAPGYASVRKCPGSLFR
jgi:FkbM family methyltransferase